MTSSTHSDKAKRGRTAQNPVEIPRKGWRDILLRVKDHIGENDLDIVSAGVAFYVLLSMFPGIASVIAIYGLLFDPQQAIAHIQSLVGVLPADARQILLDQLQTIAGAPAQDLSIGMLAGIVLALWTASRGTKSLIIALNIAYGEKDRRGFFKLNLVSIGITLIGVLTAASSVMLLAVVPFAMNFVGASEILNSAVLLTRWIVLAALMLFVLAFVYRYGAYRSSPKWIWTSVGAVVAVSLWTVAAALFSFYASNFGSYNETYGSLGAVVVLLLWIYITVFLILIGAVLNAETEHQTRRDTTVGKEKPMGERGAWVADTLGATPD